MTDSPLGLPPPRPIPLKDRAALIFVERAELDFDNGCFVAIDENAIRTVIPVGGVACLLLEPGTRVSHRVVAVAAQAGTLLVWVGEAAVRVYSAGRADSERADKLLWQAQSALNEAAQLWVVRKKYEIRFAEPAP